MDIINKAGLAVIKNERILLVQEDIGPFWLIPGGTIKEGETPEEALLRKIENELGTKLNLGSVKFIKEFEDAAAGRENTMVKIKLYSGELEAEPKIGPGIIRSSWFNSGTDTSELSPIVKNKILPYLIKGGYIK